MDAVVLTCTTGERPELMALCRRWVAKQTIVLAHVVYQAKGPVFTVLANGLARVPPDSHAIIMEDDDWYHPDHVATLLEWLDNGAPLAASPDVRRVNVPAARWNTKVSLTPGPGLVGVNGSYLPEYERLVRASNSGDRDAWVRLGLKPECPSTAVGVKGVGFGLPGAPGTTKKHDPRSPIVKSWHEDPGHAKMREWMRDDAQAYLDLLE